MRETGLFTHGRASLNFTIIPMCTQGVAVPCLCDAGQGCAMLLHHRTIDSSRSRTLALPSSQPHGSHPAPSHHRLLPRANSCLALFPTPQLPPWAIAHLIQTHSPSSPYSLSITLPTHFPSLSRRTFHPFVVSTPDLSNSSHVSFHGVRIKTFSTHVAT